MARHQGRGMASINYPIGMNLGGDPSQALVHANPDGKFTVALSAIDLGQGMKQVSRQIAAETLGVPIGTIMSRLARARRKLAEAIDPEWRAKDAPLAAKRGP